MHLVEIPEAGIRRNLPAHLGECSPKEYMDMCGLIYLFQTGQIGIDAFRLQSVYKLLNLKPTKKYLSEREEMEKLSNLDRLCELVDGFFQAEDNQLTIVQEYIHNPVPSFKPAFTEYFGPSDHFGNAKYGEYLDALRMFDQFTASSDPECMIAIAAILYRPIREDYRRAKKADDYNGDPRQAYNSKSVESRTREFARIMPAGFIYGVYLFFASFQKWLCTAVIPWGGREIDLGILFRGGGGTGPEAIPGIGMDSIAFAIAESGAFGTMEDLRQTDLWEVLIRMYDLRKRDMDAESKMPKK